MSSRFERVDTETVYDGPMFSVRKDKFRHEDGEEVQRDIVSHPGAVGVVPRESPVGHGRPGAHGDDHRGDAENGRQLRTFHAALRLVTDYGRNLKRHPGPQHGRRMARR